MPLPGMQIVMINGTDVRGFTLQQAGTYCALCPYHHAPLTLSPCPYDPITMPLCPYHHAPLTLSPCPYHHPPLTLSPCPYDPITVQQAGTYCALLHHAHAPMPLSPCSYVPIILAPRHYGSITVPVPCQHHAPMALSSSLYHANTTPLWLYHRARIMPTARPYDSITVPISCQHHAPMTLSPCQYHANTITMCDYNYYIVYIILFTGALIVANTI